MPSTEQKQEKPQQQQQLPPNIRYIGEAETIYKNADYEVKELTFPDPTGKTVWSMTICKLYPGKQTRGHSNPELSEFYTFRGGAGWAMIKDRMYECKPPMCISVNPEEYIKIVNTSAEDLVFHTFLNGRYKRPDVARKS